MNKLNLTGHLYVRLTFIMMVMNTNIFHQQTELFEY
jgi:hypothetical protein